MLNDKKISYLLLSILALDPSPVLGALGFDGLCQGSISTLSLIFSLHEDQRYFLVEEALTLYLKHFSSEQKDRPYLYLVPILLSVYDDSLCN